MALFDVTIETLSPIHLSSGRADVTVDAEVVHDAAGLPYFPAKRLKGLLYESALELVEASELAASGPAARDTLEELFRHGVEKKVQLIIHDFYIPDYENVRADLLYLEAAYGAVFQPSDVLGEFSSVRYQTAIDSDTGTAKATSFRNLRVLDAGIKFTGKIQLVNGEARHENLLILALRNLRTAGMKRSRGLGRIRCTLPDMDKRVREALDGEAK